MSLKTWTIKRIANFFVFFTIQICHWDQTAFAQQNVVAPVLVKLSHVSITPGDSLTITGYNLSPDKNDLQVTIADVPAKVISSTSTSVTVTVPELTYPQWNVTVSVSTRGVPSGNTLRLNLSSRAIPNEY